LALSSFLLAWQTRLSLACRYRAYADPYVKIVNMQEVRMTLTVARLLREFLTDPSQPRYGYDLMQATGFASGKLYPPLAKLVKAGWLLREEEQIDPSREGRPARRMYRLSKSGIEAARYELAALSQQIAPPAGRPPRLQTEGGRA
jgi:PadR family transcriptional regulator, regulatory protein PadR